MYWNGNWNCKDFVNYMEMGLTGKWECDIIESEEDEKLVQPAY